MATSRAGRSARHGASADDDLLLVGDGVVVEPFAEQVRADTGFTDEASQAMVRDPTVDARYA
jgi:hypothetical protein